MDWHQSHFALNPEAILSFVAYLNGLGSATYITGYPINSIKIPKLINAKPPTFTNPLLVKMSHSRLSISFGSGLCSQSSFSTSSGKRSRPADGRILYFSETVWVLTLSSSLPALEGALESSKGLPPYRLSRPPPSELQLVRRDGKAEGSGDLAGESSSLNRCVLERDGGRSNSADSAGPKGYIPPEDDA